jgi:exosortase
VTAKPADEVVRSAGWVAALVAVVAALAFAYYPVLTYSAQQWLKPDYSHGFLVPVFSVYLAWRWREWAPKQITWPNPWGLVFITCGAAIYLAARLTNVALEWLQGLSLVVNLCGAAVLLGGWPALRWLWPALAFLIFMFPLPYRVEHFLGWQLQKTAALASTFVLQTIGYPTYTEGVVIHVRDQSLEVEKACSGLSMLLTFVALSTAVALVVRRPWPDRLLILLSAAPVAVLSNVARIALTGVLYVEAGEEVGKRVFHDFAGWLMMPFALGVLWVELKLLDWVLQEDLGRASRDEVLRMTVGKPAYLFMHTVEGSPGTGKPAVGPGTPGGSGR